MTPLQFYELQHKDINFYKVNGYVWAHW